MDKFDFSDDLGDNVEVIYLDDDEEIDEKDEMEDEGMEGSGDVAENQEDIEAEIVDMSKLTFGKHTMSVFCCDISADGSLAVTGAQDDVAYVWKIANGEVYLECTGHSDSVTEVSFNFDSQYVVTGDMGGLIQVWNIKEKKLIWCYGGDDLEWLRWHHLANVLIAGIQSGDIFIWQIPQGHCKVLASHGAPSTFGQILPDGKKLVAGYSDGQMKLWDMKAATAVWQVGDLDGITNIEINEEGTLLAVAPKSHVIKIADGKLVGKFINTEEEDVEFLLFSSELGVLITGSLSGRLCLWDVGKQTLRYEVNIKNCAMTGMKWAANSKFLVSTTDGEIHVGDARSGTLVQTLTGHKEDILSMCVSKEKTFLISTSDDCTAKVFDLKIE